MAEKRVTIFIMKSDFQWIIHSICLRIGLYPKLFLFKFLRWMK